MDLLIPIAVFVFIVLCVLGAYFLIRPPSVAAARLKQLDKENEDKPEEEQQHVTAKLVERLAEPFNRLAPPSASDAQKLQKRLMSAGFRSPGAPTIYRALQISVLIGTPLLTALGIIAAGRSLQDSLTWVLIACGVGYIGPSYLLDYLANSRQDRIRYGLADALDLMVISIEAGLGMNAALVRVSEEFKQAYPDISEEFELVNLEIRVGRAREEALRNLAERAGVEDLRALCAMLIQADRFGTSITRAIRAFSDSLRVRRRQRAEQAAQKAAVKLLMPLALFLFPTLFIAILGPAAIQMMDNFFNK